jgi:hypothetical protein
LRAKFERDVAIRSTEEIFMAITKKSIVRDVTSWFTEPEKHNYTVEGCTFQGVIVYEKAKTRPGGVNRIAMWVDESSKKMWWDLPGERRMMPATAQPAEAWEGAKPVGFASTLEEALALLFPGGI